MSKNRDVQIPSQQTSQSNSKSDDAGCGFLKKECGCTALSPQNGIPDFEIVTFCNTESNVSLIFRASFKQ